MRTIADKLQIYDVLIKRIDTLQRISNGFLYHSDTLPFFWIGGTYLFVTHSWRSATHVLALPPRPPKKPIILKKKVANFVFYNLTYRITTCPSDVVITWDENLGLDDFTLVAIN